MPRSRPPTGGDPPPLRLKGLYASCGGFPASKKYYWDLTSDLRARTSGTGIGTVFVEEDTLEQVLEAEASASMARSNVQNLFSLGAK